MFNNKMLTIAIAMVIVLTFINVAKAQVVTDGLVSYWSFDKDTIDGDTVKDVFGNNNGTIMGNPEVVEGKVGDGLDFHGNGDYVTVPDDESLHLWETFTLECWLYQKQQLTEGRLIDKCTAGASDGPHFDQYPGMKLRCCSCAGGGCTSANTVYSLEEWHHGVVTFNKGAVKLYLDGSLDGEGDVGSPLAGNSLPLRIAATASDPASCFFVGIIDEVRVYNRALSEDEVNQNMNAEGLAVVSPANKLSEIWGKIKVSK